MVPHQMSELLLSLVAKKFGVSQLTKYNMTSFYFFFYLSLTHTFHMEGLDVNGTRAFLLNLKITPMLAYVGHCQGI